MNIIPLKPLPNQTVTSILGNQAVTLRVYAKFYGLFIDVLVNDVAVIGGVICQDRNRIVRSDYLGFVGDLVFFNLYGDSDPQINGLGTTYVLAYLDPDEVKAHVTA